MEAVARRNLTASEAAQWEGVRWARDAWLSRRAHPVEDGLVEIALILAGASALPVLVAAIRHLVAGRRVQQGATIQLKIDGSTLELTGASDDQQAALIDSFLRQVAGDDARSEGERDDAG